MTNTLDAWDAVAEALHKWHPPIDAQPVGKGICAYQPCVLARQVRTTLQRLEKNEVTVSDCH